MKEIIAVAAIFGAVAVSVYISVEVWTECRATNSFFYCLRLVAR